MHHGSHDNFEDRFIFEDQDETSRVADKGRPIGAKMDAISAGNAKHNKELTILLKSEGQNEADWWTSDRWSSWQG